MFEYLDMQPKVALHGGVVLPTHSVKGNVSFENGARSGKMFKLSLGKGT